MTQRVSGQRFRQRKLSTKQNLPVVREHEVEQLADDDASRHIPKVETGVEKGEEIVSFPTRPLWAFTLIQATVPSRQRFGARELVHRSALHLLTLSPSHSHTLTILRRSTICKP